MNGTLLICRLLVLAFVSTAPANNALSKPSSSSKTHAEQPVVASQPPYQRRDTWYEFMLKQFNPNNVDYGMWLEQHRREFIEARLKNPCVGYCVFLGCALIVMIATSLKQWVDHRRTMSITAEMMADIYNQDTYSRQVAQDAIERYNKHIERCNRVIESGESPLASASVAAEIEQLRLELMRTAEQRDTAIKERDAAREDMRRKSEILAELSLRLENRTNIAPGSNGAKLSSDMRSDTKLVTHINNLQEQLYAERNNNRRARSK